VDHSAKRPSASGTSVVFSSGMPAFASDSAPTIVAPMRYCT
jgi:hypothetical protein